MSDYPDSIQSLQHAARPHLEALRQLIALLVLVSFIVVDNVQNPMALNLGNHVEHK